MKLELKHLIPYLLHNLKWTDGDDHTNTIIGISGDTLEFISEQGDFDSCQINLIEDKPILRPLSDLTKEIEINGERFVPMVKLFEMINISELQVMYENETPYKLGEKNGCQYIIFDNYDFDDIYGHAEYEVQFYFQNGCLVLDVPVWINNVIENNYNLYNKLFEWHFDVFGLIQKGLAVDINTLSQQFTLNRF
jgi:hypothetical protein